MPAIELIPPSPFHTFYHKTTFLASKDRIMPPNSLIGRWCLASSGMKAARFCCCLLPPPPPLHRFHPRPHPSGSSSEALPLPAPTPPPRLRAVIIIIIIGRARLRAGSSSSAWRRGQREAGPASLLAASGRMRLHSCSAAPRDWGDAKSV